MRKLIIIRTCLRDDFISYLCYKSFKEIVPNCDFIFFAEHGNYKWITKAKDGIIFFRESCDNFGGKDGALSLIKSLRILISKINISMYEYVALSDADITIKKNPFEHTFCFGGIKDVNNKRHYSGQLLLFNSIIFDDVIHYGFYDEIINEIIEEEKSVADDTCLSYAATRITKNLIYPLPYDFYNKQYWIHEKKYQLEDGFTDTE